MDTQNSITTTVEDSNVATVFFLCALATLEMLLVYSFLLYFLGVFCSPSLTFFSPSLLPQIVKLAEILIVIVQQEKGRKKVEQTKKSSVLFPSFFFT